MFIFEAATTAVLICSDACLSSAFLTARVGDGHTTKCLSPTVSRG